MNQDVSQSKGTVSAKDLKPPPLAKPLEKEELKYPDGKPVNDSCGAAKENKADTTVVPESVQVGDDLANALKIVGTMLSNVKDDCGAPFEYESIRALRTLQERDQANFQRTRAMLKKENKDVSLSSLDMALRGKSADKSYSNTHHGYASNVLDKLAVGEYRPVGHDGCLYVADIQQGIWIPYTIDMLIRKITELHDGWENCERSGDYKGIALHAIDLATDTSFFEEAPVGCACSGGFYRIIGSQIVDEPLSVGHRQRVKLDVTPVSMATPLFDAFLHDTFESPVTGEEEQQRVLLQEIAGATMFGLMAKHQKAVLFYEPFGRAGKGTLETILRQLVPRKFITAVSPFNWDREYYLASLIGSRLNVVGELDGGKPIPASAFKTVTGRDLLTGRYPTGRPISFRNEATHIFMSNHLINTVEHSEAFFARWLLVSFPNSRLKSGKPIDPDLADRIIFNELPGIIQWAMLGALRLIENGNFTLSSAHNDLKEKWRRSSNSLEEFIYEACERDTGYHLRRADLYKAYKNWCGENGRHPFAKAKVKELLEHNIGVGISLAVLDGNEIFRGVRLKSPEEVSRFANLTF